MRRGKFITIEGGVGLNSKAIIRHVGSLLKDNNIQFVTTQEPGGTPVGEKVRSLMLNNKMFPMTETLLLHAARLEHLKNVIIPSLEEGKWVVCERFSDSTFAFQVFAQGVDKTFYKTLQDLTDCDIQPDLTILTHMYSQVNKTTEETDKFEETSQEFREKVLSAYKELVMTEPNRFVFWSDENKKDEAALEALKQFLNLA